MRIHLEIPHTISRQRNNFLRSMSSLPRQGLGIEQGGTGVRQHFKAGMRIAYRPVGDASIPPTPGPLQFSQLTRGSVRRGRSS